MRRFAAQGPAGDVAPEQFPVGPLHDPFVRIHALGVHDRRDAGAGALELVGGGVEHLERLAQQRLARSAEDAADFFVAVLDHALA
ncbi:hypothetical protein D3C72_1879880 [compost metagenome]